MLNTYITINNISKEIEVVLCLHQDYASLENIDYEFTEITNLIPENLRDDTDKIQFYLDTGKTEGHEVMYDEELNSVNDRIHGYYINNSLHWFDLQNLEDNAQYIELLEND